MRNKIGLLSWFLGICCISIGCVSSKTWIGASEDDVIDRFGMPDKSYATNDRKYLVYDFTGINYAFDTSDISVTPISHQEQNGRCLGTFIVEDGICIYSPFF